MGKGEDTLEVVEEEEETEVVETLELEEEREVDMGVEEETTSTKRLSKLRD